MKTICHFIFTGMLIFLICSCEKTKIEKSTESKKFEVKDVSKIKLDPILEKAAKEYPISKSKGIKSLSTSIPGLDLGYINIPKEFSGCLDTTTTPRRIKDLKLGLSLDAYNFTRETQAKLGFLGFGNIDIKKSETVVVVEYSQTGGQYCKNKRLYYGIGARLMMKIKETHHGAKINTPQQISASVTFGKADVIFSIKTFGIVGPGVSNLVKAGSMTENTYTEFLSQISNLIFDAYSDSSRFIIEPQPLFLK